MVQLSQEIASAEGASMPFSEWWSQIQRCKRLSQWQTKLQSLGMPATDIQLTSSFTKVGQIMHARMLRDGTWSATDLQNIVIG
eukprot:225222-Pyramimonas_sp.AAC.1